MGTNFGCAATESTPIVQHPEEMLHVENLKQPQNPICLEVWMKAGTNTAQQAQNFIFQAELKGFKWFKDARWQEMQTFNMFPTNKIT